MAMNRIMLLVEEPLSPAALMTKAWTAREIAWARREGRQFLRALRGLAGLEPWRYIVIPDREVQRGT